MPLSVVRRALGGVVVAATMSCGSALSPEDVAAVRTATDRYVQAALAADWDGWAALSSDSAVFLLPNASPVEGRPALRQWITAYRGMDSFSTTGLVVQGQGDLAVVRGVYAYTMRGAPAVGDTGKFLTVWRRQPDGQWRISHNIWNSDRPAGSVR
jgi:ketosteroid isomerase-like protein